jgi:hypothetical protein
MALMLDYSFVASLHDELQHNDNIHNPCQLPSAALCNSMSRVPSTISSCSRCRGTLVVGTPKQNRSHPTYQFYAHCLHVKAQ